MMYDIAKNVVNPTKNSVGNVRAVLFQFKNLSIEMITPFIGLFDDLSILEPFLFYKYQTRTF